MNDAFLESISNGSETRISSHTGKIGMLFQNKLDDLGDAMAKGGKIRDVTLNNVTNSAPDFTRFAQGLLHSPDLRSLDLQSNAISADSAQQIADGLRGKADLTEVNLSKCKLDAKGVAVVAEALATCPNLKKVTFNDNPLGAEGCAAIAEMMQSLPWLENLKMKDCEIGLEGLAHITEALPFCRRLVELDCADQSVLQDGGKLVQNAMEKQANPNLIIIHPSGLDVEELRKTNREEALSIKDSLVACKGDFGKLTAAQIGATYDLLPAINRATGNKLPVIQQFENYIDSLPRVDDRESITLADLTGTGTDDRTALANPRTWQRLPTVLQKLEAAGEKLTLDTLMQPNRDGSSYLTTALATAPDIVIPALNAHGVQLTGDILLNNRQPTEALEAIIARNAGSDLFTHDNWRGRSSDEMRTVYQAIPEAQRNQVGGLHTLAAQLSSEQGKSSRQAGR